ncbi:MAG: hypothetical protein ABEH38_04350 [Flavobacteriales bacterium]
MGLLRCSLSPLFAIVLLNGTVLGQNDTLEAKNDTLKAKKDTGKGSPSSIEISPGFENYSAQTSFAPGNYLYFQGYLTISDRVSAFMKYSTDLTPQTFDHSVVAAGLRGMAPEFSESMRAWGGLFYARDVNGQADHIAVKVCLLGHQGRDITLGLLPITFTYRLDGPDQFGVIYEFFTVGGRF